MKTVLGLVAMAVVVAALSSYCTLRWVAARPAMAPANGDAWLHRELHFTPEQEKALKRIEERFKQKEDAHRAEMRAANRRLAAAIRRGDPDAPEIAAAVQAIYLHMGELQKESIDHLFEMRAELAPAQGGKLLQLAAKTLEETP